MNLVFVHVSFFEKKFETCLSASLIVVRESSIVISRSKHEINSESDFLNTVLLPVIISLAEFTCIPGMI